MAKISSSYICQQCGFSSSSYLGRCPECGSWGSLVEQVVSDKRQVNKKVLKPPQIVSLKDIEKKHYLRINTGFEEFDRVLGGGIVAGSVVLIAGDPGIGKSTLLSQLAINIDNALGALSLGASRQSNSPAVPDQTLTGLRDTVPPSLNRTVLYVAGEESPQQIKIRVDRIKENADLSILSEVDVDLIILSIEKYQPLLVIIDSIQTLETQDLSSPPGSVGQVRECAYRLQKVAKSLHIPIFLVGHVTKEGTVAGPRTLEHLVDAVLSLEGDMTSNFRILRGLKNRFGPTDEVGIFEMEERGLVEVKNPSKVFLDQKVNAPGSAVVPIINGVRAILVEIQALVTKTNLPIPRRTSSGVDINRLQLLVAVLQKRLGLPLFATDIFVNVTGGIKISEPAADLAVAMAVYSSFKDKAIDAKTCFVGEVGLLAELRAVRFIDKRKNEAQKLGFKNVVSFENIKSLAQAVNLVFK